MNDQEFIQKILVMEKEIAELKQKKSIGLRNRFINKKTRFTKRALLPLGIACFLITTTIALAATIPNTFVSGDPISSSQMNENFSYIIDQLNSFSAPGSAYSNNAAAPADSVHIDALGNVGVGTSSPSQKLEVSGNIKSSGNIEAEGILNAQGYANQLQRASDGVFETAQTGVEYFSLDQYGGIFGTVYRQYYTTALPADLTSGNNVSRLLEYLIIGHNGSDRYPTHWKDGGNTMRIALSGTSGNGNLDLSASGVFTGNVIEGWVDYTK